MAWIKKTARGYQVISKVLEVQTHSRLDLEEANKIKKEWEETENITDSKKIIIFPDQKL